MGRALLSEYFGNNNYQWVNVYRALCFVLKTDQLLASIPITWDTREGDQNEAQPPTQGMMPWIAVVPLEIPFKRETEDLDQGRFRCRVDIAVSGTNWDDLGNLAGAIRDAIVYTKVMDGGQTVINYFYASGTNNFWIKQAGVGVKRTEGTPPDTASPAPPAVVDQIASFIVEFQLLTTVLGSNFYDFPSL